MPVYIPDDRDTVVLLNDIPPWNVGAANATLIHGAHALAVVYTLSRRAPGWDGTTARAVDAGTRDLPAAVVRFTRPRAAMFGPPSDEAFDGHPLASRGLEPWDAFEVVDSSWVRQLERMNAVHPAHRPEHFADYRHFILAFKDAVFECVATGYTSELTHGPVAELAAHEAARLGDRRADSAQDARETFAAVARRCCAWIESPTTEGLGRRLHQARDLLAELIAAAGSLPPDAGDHDLAAVSPRPAAAPDFGAFEHYREVLDPYSDESVVGGSLSDDLLDIHGDLQRGLVAWDAGDQRGAVWDWRFHFEQHWGNHAVAALRALHRACSACPAKVSH